jgi:peptidoglycan/xylan/chitin deacetylase (PgdA/CDA1 family)
MPARLLRAMNPGLSNASLKPGNAVLVVERSDGNGLKPALRTDRPTTRGLEQEFVRGVRGRKEIALTFDCGWAVDRDLSQMLETLHRLDVHASFFLTGIFLRNVPNAPARIVLAGHRLGNHTMTHPRCTNLSDWQFLAQLDGVEQWVSAGPSTRTLRLAGRTRASALPDAPSTSTLGRSAPSTLGFPAPSTLGHSAPSTLGFPAPSTLGFPAPSTLGFPAPATGTLENILFSSGTLSAGRLTSGSLTTRPFWRPPFGDRDKRILRIAAQAGYRAVYWTVDSLDWVEKPAATPESVFRQVCERPFERAKDDPDPLDGAIILMHIAGKPTRQAIERIVPYLKERGYRFVTVQRLLEP